MARALVLGSAAVDTIARVDAFPGPDMIVPAREVLRLPGGSSANVAVALARLGVSVSFLGCAGDDADGALIRESFASEGVGTEGLIKLPGARSAGVFIAVNECGARVMYALGGESVYTDPAQLNGQDCDAELLYIGEAFNDVGVAAAERVKNRGGTVCFGPGGVMCGYGLDAIGPLIACADTVFVSRPELALLGGTESVRAGALVLLDAGAGAVVVTEGAGGASVHTKEACVFEPAHIVEHAVDTTGAGDAFTGAYLYALLCGKMPAQRLRFAHDCAAFAIARMGARTSPRLEEVTWED